MKICKTRRDVKKALRIVREKRQTVGFVPTMGALHEGHLSLVEIAKAKSDVVVCSIFVNPRQFDDQRDYEAYQINLETDVMLLEQAGVDILFVPDVETMYPQGFQTTVEVTQLSAPFEGERRLGHFRGVTTVVCTLLGIVAPDNAIFGEKDFQQLRIVERMVADLGLDVTIVRGPLVRDSNGLALSSRNMRLSDSRRKDASNIFRALSEMVAAVHAGERNVEQIRSIGLRRLEAIVEAEVEYLAIVCEESLEELRELDRLARILVVVQIDGVRLLDNMSIEL